MGLFGLRRSFDFTRPAISGNQARMTQNTSDPFSLQGRVALVTGSSTGLGKRMAIALGRAGAKVAINYQNNQARAETAFAEFQAAGCDGMLVRGNVIDEGEVARMTAEIAGQLGPVDILVLNATPDQPQKPI